MVNPRLAATGILKSETETEKLSDLIEKHICDRQTQNLRLRDPLLCYARFPTPKGVSCVACRSLCSCSVACSILPMSLSLLSKN